MVETKTLGSKLNEELISLLLVEFEESTFNKLPVKYGGGKIFSHPLIGVSKGDDPIFDKYKNMIGPDHMTPLEMWTSCGKDPVSASDLHIISIVFPFSEQIRKEGTNFGEIGRMKIPAEIYTVGRNYGNEFKNIILTQTSNFLKEKGYSAVTSKESNAYSILLKGKFYTTWSERYMAFAAGLGSLGLHEGIITEDGCNVRLGSIVTDAPLEITKRKSDEPYANCLFYMKAECKECAKQCPAGAISEKGFNPIKCNKYRMKVARKVEPSLSMILKPDSRRVNWKLKEDIFITGCEMCQFGVKCTDRNPMVSEYLDFF